MLTICCLQPRHRALFLVLSHHACYPHWNLQADTEFLAERERQLSEWRDWLVAKKAAVEEREAFAREQLGNRCVR